MKIQKDNFGLGELKKPVTKDTQNTDIALFL